MMHRASYRITCTETCALYKDRKCNFYLIVDSQATPERIRPGRPCLHPGVFSDGYSRNIVQLDPDITFNGEIKRQKIRTRKQGRTNKRIK